MWFNKKDKSDESTPRATSRNGRTSDMRSELGLGGNDYTQNNSAQPRATRRIGANKAVTQDAAGNTYNEDVLLHDLKVRARRRLIGALVLLAAAFVILPWIFDDNRKQTAPVVTVSVPDQKIQFEVQNPRVAAATSSSADNLKPVSSEKPADAAAKSKAEEKVADKPAEVPKAAKFVVHIGVVSNKADLDALSKRLAAKGVKPVTEVVKVGGESKTRVRLGPFDSQASAQAVADKVKGAAKNPVVLEVK